MKPKVVVLTCLGSAITAPVLEALEGEQVEIAAILIDGRLSEKDLQIEADRLDKSFRRVELSEMDLPHIPCFFVENHNSPSSLNLIKTLKADYTVNAGTPRILKNEILTVNGGVINCHPGILPKYRGCTAVEWSIYNNDPVGATAHFMNSEIDEGPILISEPMTIHKGESYESIRTRMIGHQAWLIGKAVVYAFKNHYSISSCASQAPETGSYFKPIPPELLLEVKSRLAQGSYKSP